MGKKQGFKGAVQQRYRRSPCTKQNMVWVPKIASWEKEYCEKVGLFRWENFVEAKKATQFSHRVLEWNDSAAEEAFHRSKNRFFAGIPHELSPDLYIDEIHWDDDAGVELDVGLMESASADEEEDGDRNVPDYYDVRIEDIKPTGWDCKVEDFSPANILTGQIIGY